MRIERANRIQLAARIPFRPNDSRPAVAIATTGRVDTTAASVRQS